MPVTDCHPLDLVFKEAEQEYTDSLKIYKQRMSNGYWGKVRQVGTFPLGQGTTLKDTRLHRVGMGPLQWEGIKDGLCETNLCETPIAQRVVNPGWEDIEITLQKTKVSTDWICLDSLLFRKMATQQLAAFETGFRERVADSWDDKLRVEYLHRCANKMMFVNPVTISDDTNCDCAESQCGADAIQAGGWMFYTNPTVNGVPGQVNPNFILVNLAPTSLVNANGYSQIGAASVDMFEQAAIELEFSNENRPFMGEGLDLYDVVLPDARMGRDLRRQEDAEMNNAMSYGGFNAQDLKRTIGTKFMLRDQYSFRYDRFAWKGFPDTEYNAALVAQEGYAFDAADPDTWPRIKRVYPYYPVVNPNGGIKWIPNSYFTTAPFGIATIFTPEVIDYMGYPNIFAAGSAKKEAWGSSLDYAGTAVWINPDEPCNRERNKGYWEARMGLAIKPNRTEFGFAWLVQIPNKVQLNSVCCPLPSTPCFETPTDYCFGTTSGTESALSGLRGAGAVVGYNGVF